MGLRWGAHRQPRALLWSGCSPMWGPGAGKNTPNPPPPPPHLTHTHTRAHTGSLSLSLPLPLGPPNQLQYCQRKSMQLVCAGLTCTGGIGGQCSPASSLAPAACRSSMTRTARISLHSVFPCGSPCNQTGPRSQATGQAVGFAVLGRGQQAKLRSLSTLGAWCWQGRTPQARTRGRACPARRWRMRHACPACSCPSRLGLTSSNQ